MPDAFFARGQKRKRATGQAHSAVARKVQRAQRTAARPKASKRRDEELDSEGTAEDDRFHNIDDLDLRRPDSAASGDEDENETPAAKRLRLARVYIDSLRKDIGDGDFNAADIDKDMLSARLKQDVQEHAGKMYLHVADRFQLSSTSSLRVRGHRLSVTCATATEDGKWMFSAGKEGLIIKWDLASGKEVKRFPKLRSGDAKGANDRKGKRIAGPDAPGHFDEVLALAVSSDGKYLASGGKDKRVCIWDADKGDWIRAFPGHKDSISGLAFRKDTLQLYSASCDRTVRLFDLSVMGFVETLFGHQDSIMGIDALKAETAVTVGGRDRTARFWKVADESQLVFRGGKSTVRELLESGIEDEQAEVHTTSRTTTAPSQTFIEGSVDCIAMIDETTFVSGGDSGSLCLWTTVKKKPVFTVPLAHGAHQHRSETEGIIEGPRWINALACLRYADVVASGSCDGFVRLWKVDSKMRSLASLGAVTCPGVINSLQIIAPPALLSAAPWVHNQGHRSLNGRSSKMALHGVVVVAAVGQEPRLGRWMRLRGDGIVNCISVTAINIS